MIIETRDGQKHEVLLPQGEHLLEYVRNADRALRKEELFDGLLDVLEEAMQVAVFEKHPFRGWHMKATQVIKAAQSL